MRRKTRYLRFRPMLLFVALLRLQPVGFAAEEKAAGPDPRVRPGAKFSLTFPKLPKDRKGAESQMQVSIPQSYDPSKCYPLVAWLGGGDGGSSVGSGASLADPDKFILVGMPYPQGANNAGQSNMVGNFPVIWAYHKAMLAKLHEVIPNINPDLRVLAGFSNGGHCIDGVLACGALEYFNTFILADGGGAKGSPGRYPSARGCHMFICWGEKSPNKGPSSGLAKKAAKAGMKVRAVEMKGVGHKFESDYVQMAREWIETVVMPDAVDAMMRRAKKLKSRDPAGALAAANGVGLLAGDLDEKDKARLEKIVEDIEKSGAKELEKIKAKLGDDATPAKRKVTEGKLKSFLEKYRGTKAAAEAAELAGTGEKAATGAEEE